MLCRILATAASHGLREMLRQASKRYTLGRHVGAGGALQGGGAPSWCVSGYTLCQAVGSAHPLKEICCFNPCCPEPCHALPLRPLGELESAGGAAASGTALPHSHTLLFAPGGSCRPFHQLAAGSAGELPGPTGLSRRNAGTEDRSRSGRRNVGAQPVRLFSHTVRRELSFQIRFQRAPRTGAVPGQIAGDPPGCGLSGGRIPRPCAHHRFRRRIQPARCGGHPVLDPPRAGHSAAGGDAGKALGLVPRLRRAVGAVVFSSFPT